MGMYDSFIREDGYDIQVKCFDEFSGGFRNVYNIGNNVPDCRMSFNFQIVDRYGCNYNIFPYRLEEDVIFIRNGNYIGTKKYNELNDEDCVMCIDKHGDLLQALSPKDYIELHDKYYTE